jgi:hypothetical protein
MTSYTRPAGNKDASLPHTPPSHTSVHSGHRTRPPKERHTRLDVPAASETRLDSGAAPRRRKPGTWIEHNADRRVDGNSDARPQGASRSEGELEGNRCIARASRPRASTLVEPRRGAYPCRDAACCGRSRTHLARTQPATQRGFRRGMTSPPWAHAVASRDQTQDFERQREVARRTHDDGRRTRMHGDRRFTRLKPRRNALSQPRPINVEMVSCASRLENQMASREDTRTDAREARRIPIWNRDG